MRLLISRAASVVLSARARTSPATTAKPRLLPYGDVSDIQPTPPQESFEAQKRTASFSEPIEPLAGRRQRRTWRLRRQHALVGYALGGEPGARLAAHLGMRLSGAALLGQMRAAGCAAPDSEPRVVGIDDWAMTRSRYYGTIVVDLELRKPLELLTGRDSSTVDTWLAAHPGISIVARDRSGPYSEAVTRSLAAAIQAS